MSKVESRMTRKSYNSFEHHSNFHRIESKDKEGENLQTWINKSVALGTNNVEQHRGWETADRVGLKREY